MDRDLSLLIEELAANAMPAPQTVDEGGWRLRAAPEWPFRRTNSAVPLGASPDPLVVERFYAERKLPARVRLSPAAPDGLDDALAARGYEHEAPVDILISAPDVVRDRTSAAHRVTLSDSLAPQHAATDRDRGYAEILRMVAPAGFHAVASVDGAPVGSGIGVVEGDWVGIFAMQTAPEFRRQGVARSVIHALASLAPRCYLQVEADNDPAQALYESIGFTRLHGYHYRTRA